MRGADEHSGSLFSYIDLESRIPEAHPLRAIRAIVDAALADLNAAFQAMYSPIGRPSIPPENLLRASLLQAFYTIRSERQLMERLDFDLSGVTLRHALNKVAEESGARFWILRRFPDRTFEISTQTGL